jgi:charged multivesicular body protein 4
MNLFFGKAKTKTTAKDAIYKLRDTLDMLEKRQTYLEAKVENELKIAKANATKNRRGKWSGTMETKAKAV